VAHPAHRVDCIGGWSNIRCGDGGGKAAFEMKVEIRFVLDHGDPHHERLVLHVLRDVDIGDFMLIRTRFEGNQVTTEVVNTFWFPDKPVIAGDIVVVYTKSGNDRQKAIADDHTAHFFYWGQDSPLWDDESVAPVLLYAPEWVSKAPKDLAASPA